MEPALMDVGNPHATHDEDDLERYPILKAEQIRRVWRFLNGIVMPQGQGMRYDQDKWIEKYHSTRLDTIRGSYDGNSEDFCSWYEAINTMHDMLVNPGRAVMHRYHRTKEIKRMSKYIMRNGVKDVSV